MNAQFLIQKVYDLFFRSTPIARDVQSLLKDRGEVAIVNDHIAFRTFNDKRINKEAFAHCFTRLGYKIRGYYEFPEKKLEALHLEHPELPKIFISELKIEEFSQEFQDLVRKLLREVGPKLVENLQFPVLGCVWRVDRETYERLRQESEYAAWLAAWGLRPNHCTVSVRDLEVIKGIAELNDFLEANSIKLNSRGGKIKGSKVQFLEQSSTMADSMDHVFAGDEHLEEMSKIPGCYYEFAMRYRDPSTGQIFNGFIPESANKIFESTDHDD